MADLRSDDLKLEAVVIPVSDVDRAKAFYGKLGWRLDADFAFDNGFRVVQFTPPGSGCSVQRQEQEQRQEQIRGSVRCAQDDSEKQTTTVGSTLGFDSGVQLWGSTQCTATWPSKSTMRVSPETCMEWIFSWSSWMS